MKKEISNSDYKSYQKEIKEKNYRDYYKRKKRETVSKGFGIAGTILFVLILISLFRSLYFDSSSVFNFSSFLESLSNYSANIDVADIMQKINLQIVNEWDILDGFRRFINNILSTFEVIIYIVLCIASLFEFVIWTLTNVFLV